MSIRMTAHVSRFLLVAVLALTLLVLSLGVIAHRSTVMDAAGGTNEMVGGAVQRCCRMAQVTPKSTTLLATARPGHLMASVNMPGIALLA